MSINGIIGNLQKAKQFVGNVLGYVADSDIDRKLKNTNDSIKEARVHIEKVKDMMIEKVERLEKLEKLADMTKIKTKIDEKIKIMENRVDETVSRQYSFIDEQGGICRYMKDDIMKLYQRQNFDKIQLEALAYKEKAIVEKEQELAEKQKQLLDKAETVFNDMEEYYRRTDAKLAIIDVYMEKVKKITVPPVQIAHDPLTDISDSYPEEKE